MIRTALLGSLLAIVTLPSCSRERREEPAARQAGRDAYRAAEEVKRGAQRAAKEIRKAGKEMREGWNEAKRQKKTVKK